MTRFLKLCFMLSVASWQLTQIFAEEDYYQTLGISKDASLKEIRKAFKKLALKLHPDKNTNDPNAHDNFVQINHIYEVLKDEDMRKKYDKYGEEGLKEDHPGGGRYESYSYYRDEFGIYDDDPEVVTLDGGDFDAAVNSGEAWFVNFYSPRCSHCHELAPTWRKFAEEFSGAINIGAVNCHDNRWVCNQNGIYSYPSLVIFVKNRKPIKYQGDRSKKDLIRFVMKHVNIEVVDLWDGNLDEELKKHGALPWVISFCGEASDDDMEGDCPSRTTKRKLAGLMNGLAYVGSVDCETSEELCKRANITEKLGVYYYPTGAFPDEHNQMHHFDSLDAREIHAEFMNKLVPGIPEFSTAKLQAIVQKKRALIFAQFSNDEVDEKETSLKKLPALLKEHSITVAKVKCQEGSWCKDKLHLTQDASIVFKGKGLDNFEVFHGRPNTAELSSFAQESSTARVLTLNPSYFNDGVMADSNRLWFVDFFAPWCPPCRALLPELRKASNNLNDISFGTVDCTMFKEICSEFGINSYPTTKLFNQSKITEYTGNHNSHGILQFVQDLVSPPYEHLTPKTFEAMVQNREPGITWIVDFYANWCGPCRQLMPEWRRMAKMLSGIVHVGAIDCAKGNHNQFCKRQMVDGYPEIRLFPAKKHVNSKPLYSVYDDWNRHASALAGWALNFVPNDVVDMKPKDFTDGLPSDESAWLLDFYAPWCGHCHAFAPKFVLTSMRFKGRVKFGKVNCQQLPSVCSRAGVHAYPTVFFYPPKSPNKKRPAKKQIDSQEPEAITRIVDSYMDAYPDEAKKKTKSKKHKDEL
ncbi:dnaJ homolog subfamily C member 10-like isoform X1 [Clavelina lepadiformis]|uniref:dnaJ homolog subfamily C member 10-like isoform X1 n=1 Tax=Clavelina lepadiformis TaxID=159417 RepID=UPI004042E0F6